MPMCKVTKHIPIYAVIWPWFELNWLSSPPSLTLGLVEHRQFARARFIKIGGYFFLSVEL